VNGRVPIYFGANSPRTLRLAGEIADGWLSVPLSSKLYEKRLKSVREGAEKAGRSLDNFDTGVYLYTSVTEKAQEAYNQIKTIRSQVLPSPEILREGYYHIELPNELESLSYFKALADANWIERFLQYGELIPLEAAIEFSVAGTTDERIKKIEEYIKAGVKHFLLMNVGLDPRQVLTFYSEGIIPYFKQRS